jgi:plasmid stabilization system protein ParE
MAKKEVIWSLRAQQDRRDILEYWINRTKSKSYSEKLYQLFDSSIELISKHSNVGKRTDLPDVRIKIVRDYFIIYQHKTNRIEILTIWDSRRDPNKLSERMQ